uniref:(northern house mosquito) hypothetical protein n=1 Tax=Culex pipiens TaxID=7175 RepID=A0A8D8DDH6_CULPI
MSLQGDEGSSTCICSTAAMASPRLFLPAAPGLVLQVVRQWRYLYTHHRQPPKITMVANSDIIALKSTFEGLTIGTCSESSVQLFSSVHLGQFTIPSLKNPFPMQESSSSSSHGSKPSVSQSRFTVTTNCTSRVLFKYDNGSVLSKFIVIRIWPPSSEKTRGALFSSDSQKRNFFSLLFLTTMLSMQIP